MSMWKALVIALLGSVMLFHFSAIWYIRGNQYELTSIDYYERDLRHGEVMARHQAGSAYQWDCRISEDRRGFYLHVTDGNGTTVALDRVRVNLYRPNAAGQDRQLTLERAADGSYSTALEPLPRGRWNIAVDAEIENAPVGFTRKAVVP